MQENIDYHEERIYASTRLIIVFIFTLASFMISTEMIPRIPLVRLVLGGMIAFTLLYNAFITYRPEMLVSLRKNLLIFIDLLALTLFIVIFEQKGIYLFAFYVLIVMQSGLYFGVKYIYTSLFSAMLSWMFLAEYSEYWEKHYDVILAYAITTLLTSMFALRFIRRTEEVELQEQNLADAQNIHREYASLESMADRDTYQANIEKMISKKTPFNLLFIGLEKFNTIVEKHGQEMGESVMNEVAKRLNESLSDDDFIARLGKREFVIISKQERSTLRTFLNTIQKNIHTTCTIDKIDIALNVNIGVSLFPENGQSTMVINKAAGEALHAAEKNPKVDHVFYAGYDIK